jgi:hypothetical protein
VQAAGDDHQVDAAFQAQLRCLRVNRDGFDLAVRLRQTLEEQLRTLCVERRTLILRSIRIGIRHEQTAALRERRCQELGVPTFTRSVLEHRLRRLEAEELQRLQRVTCRVALGVARRAVLACDRSVECGAGGAVALVRQRLGLRA